MKTFSDLKTIAPMPLVERKTLEVGALFAGRYEVLRQIGEGGMGVVYLATDRHTADTIALKLIHPDLLNGEDAVKRLIAEGLTARQIRHPKDRRRLRCGPGSRQPYFTMEFVGGGSLRSWMISHAASDHEIPLTAAVGVIKSMLSGIAEAHRKGIVHRDLKPENVLLTGDPDDGDFDLKILEFRHRQSREDAADHVEPSGRDGSVYGARADGRRPKRSDLPPTSIRLSVMFYELLMEAAPLARLDPISKRRPEVPKAIDEQIEKGLSARPRSRHASVLEFEQALDAALKPAAPPAPVKPEPLPAPPSPLPPQNIDPRPEPPLPQPQPKPPTPPTPPPQPIPGPRRGVWAGMSPESTQDRVRGDRVRGDCDRGRWRTEKWDPPPPPPPLSERWRDRCGECLYGGAQRSELRWIRRQRERQRCELRER
jgi:serine/threonine protein kinase